MGDGEARESTRCCCIPWNACDTRNYALELATHSVKSGVSYRNTRPPRIAGRWHTASSSSSGSTSSPPSRHTPSVTRAPRPPLSTPFSPLTSQAKVSKRRITIDGKKLVASNRSPFEKKKRRQNAEPPTRRDARAPCPRAFAVCTLRRTPRPPRPRRRTRGASRGAPRPDVLLQVNGGVSTPPLTAPDVDAPDARRSVRRPPSHPTPSPRCHRSSAG